MSTTDEQWAICANGYVYGVGPTREEARIDASQWMTDSTTGVAVQIAPEQARRILDGMVDCALLGIEATQ